MWEIQPTAIAAGSGHIWVANGRGGTLSEIDPHTNVLTKTVSLANPPQGLAAAGSEVYVSVRSSGAANRGGTLRVDIGAGGPDFLDPAYAYSPASWESLVLTNDGLVAFRRVGGAEGTQLVPDLATAIPTPTEGGRKYTFTLRPGIRYSTGRLVRPEDFRTAIERLLSVDHPASPTRGYFSGVIVGANRCAPGKPCRLPEIVTTARTITFNLTAPDPDFLTKLALPAAYAIPKGTAARLQHTVPATGPYRIDSYSTKARIIRLVRNTQFREWSEDAQPAGFPDAIELTWPPDSISPEQSYARLTSRVVSGQRGRRRLPGLASCAQADARPAHHALPEPASTRPLAGHVVLLPQHARAAVRRHARPAGCRDRVRPRCTRGICSAAESHDDLQHPPAGLLRIPTRLPVSRRPAHPAQAREGARAGIGHTPGRASSSGRRSQTLSSGRYLVRLLEALGFRASAAHGAGDAHRGLLRAASLNPAQARSGRTTSAAAADYPSSLAFFEQQLSCNAGHVEPGDEHERRRVLRPQDRRGDRARVADAGARSAAGDPPLAEDRDATSSQPHR